MDKQHMGNRGRQTIHANSGPQTALPDGNWDPGAPGQPIAGFYVMQRGRFVQVDSRMCEILGYSGIEELSGTSLRMLIRFEYEYRPCETEYEELKALCSQQILSHITICNVTKRNITGPPSASPGVVKRNNLLKIKIKTSSHGFSGQWHASCIGISGGRG